MKIKLEQRLKLTRDIVAIKRQKKVSKVAFFQLDNVKITKQCEKVIIVKV